MKKIVLIGVVALTAASAMAQGRSEDDIPKEVAERIPEKYRLSVQREIQSKARRQMKEEMERKFEIVWDVTGWTNTCGKSLLLWAGRSGTYYKYDKNGRLVMTGERNDFEEWRWRDTRQKEIQEALWKDQAVVDAAVSNAVAREIARKPQNSAQNKQPRIGPLEELIPLEEAMALAKEGKGKGYFQLALRYASGQELPLEPRTAYKMLRKAVDADYANAVLVEGLVIEEDLKTALDEPGRKTIPNTANRKNDDSPIRKILCEYCGNDASFDTGKRSPMEDSLANQVASARERGEYEKAKELAVSCVMGKYEKAKALGALTATNQIAALNKRIADYTKKEAAEEKARELRKAKWAMQSVNNRKVHAVVWAKELARYRAAFKEMFGYEMGETITHEADDKVRATGKYSSWRERKLRTPYRNFISMKLKCIGDRLWGIEIERDAGNENTSDSLEQKAVAVAKDIAQRYGIEFEKDPKIRWLWVGDGWGWAFKVRVRKDKIYAEVSDNDLWSKLQEEARTKSSASTEKETGK